MEHFIMQKYFKITELECGMTYITENKIQFLSLSTCIDKHLVYVKLRQYKVKTLTVQ